MERSETRQGGAKSIARTSGFAYFGVSAVAGAASLLFLLMNRTHGGPLIKEIKPAALIGWKNIAYGEIRKHGQPIPLYDCPLDRGVTDAAERGGFTVTRHEVTLYGLCAECAAERDEAGSGAGQP